MVLKQLLLNFYFYTPFLSVRRTKRNLCWIEKAPSSTIAFSFRGKWQHGHGWGLSGSFWDTCETQHYCLGLCPASDSFSACCLWCIFLLLINNTTGYFLSSGFMWECLLLGFCKHSNVICIHIVSFFRSERCRFLVCPDSRHLHGHCGILQFSLSANFSLGSKYLDWLTLILVLLLRLF